jgi:hypothetical protein
MYMSCIHLRCRNIDGSTTYIIDILKPDALDSLGGLRFSDLQRVTLHA